MALAAIQQWDTDVRFQLLDLLAERRLRGVQPLRRASKVQLFGDRDEVPQMAQLHGASLDVPRLKTQPATSFRNALWFD